MQQPNIREDMAIPDPVGPIKSTLLFSNSTFSSLPILHFPNSTPDLKFE